MASAKFLGQSAVSEYLGPAQGSGSVTVAPTRYTLTTPGALTYNPVGGSITTGPNGGIQFTIPVVTHPNPSTSMWVAWPLVDVAGNRVMLPSSEPYSYFEGRIRLQKLAVSSSTDNLYAGVGISSLSDLANASVSMIGGGLLELGGGRRVRLQRLLGATYTANDATSSSGQAAIADITHSFQFPSYEGVSQVVGLKADGTITAAPYDTYSVYRNQPLFAPTGAWMVVYAGCNSGSSGTLQTFEVNPWSKVMQSPANEGL